MNIAEFFAMGGYALYVWGSFGISLIVLVANILAAKRFEKKVRSEIGNMLARTTGDVR